MDLSLENYKQLWNDRYSHIGYAYGKMPNCFYREQLDRLPIGKILLPAEGEGRNAVYASIKGWSATACDLSEKGREKAIQLAGEYNVSLDYLVGDLAQLEFAAESYDVIALIYAHFPADQKAGVLCKLSSYLKKGGTIIFEAFGKGHLPFVQANPAVGGAMNERMLFSTEELNIAFSGFDVKMLEEVQVELKEGFYHNGIGSVVRFVGQKI